MTVEELIQIKISPQATGRYFALHKLVNYADNPILWLYEKQGTSSIYFEGTNDLSPILWDNVYAYQNLTEREQILADLSEVLYMWNYRTFHISSLINSLENPISFKSSRPDIVALISTSGPLLGG